MADPLLLLCGVERRFVSVAGGPPAEVLRGIDLELAEGETLAIVGPSGSGKSTLLNVIGGLDRPSAGSVLLSGREVAALDERELAALRARELGFVFQSHLLLPQCSALENVLVPTLALAARERREGAEERARRLLERAGLAGRLQHRPAQLSGGECQRVAVVRALVNRPRLVLADEPTGSLDAASAGAVGELLLEQSRAEGAALIVVTHSAELAARMGRALRMQGGRLAPAAARA